MYELINRVFVKVCASTTSVERWKVSITTLKNRQSPSGLGLIISDKLHIICKAMQNSKFRFEFRI